MCSTVGRTSQQVLRWVLPCDHNSTAQARADLPLMLQMQGLEWKLSQAINLSQLPCYWPYDVNIRADATWFWLIS